MMKTNMKKRLLSLLLTLVMILGMIPATTLTANAATLPEITGLHRGVLADCEDTNYVYWDPVEGAEKYTVKVTNGTSTGSFSLTDVNSDMNSPSGKFVIKDGYVVSGSEDYYYAKAGEYKVQITATKKYGSIEQEIASSEISFSIKEKEQISQDGTANTVSITSGKPGDAVKMTVGKSSVADIGTAITQKMLEKANYEVAYVEGVDWLASSWNKDGELELVGTIPENCPNGEYIAYIGLKSKASNAGFVIECTVLVKEALNISEIVFKTPNVIPTYWEIYDPETTYLKSVPDMLTIDTATGSFTDVNWNKYIDYQHDSEGDRWFHNSLMKYTASGTATDVTKQIHTFTEGKYAIVWDVPLFYTDPDDNELAFAENVKAYVGSSDYPVDKIEVVSDTYIRCYKYYYVYDVKPEIKSVTVNGQSVADEGTFTTNNKNVTIKTTYDSVLSDALTAYGCKVEHLSDWYLNGQHINVAKATPVDQGDGTSTKTHTRPLNDGDVLKVYGRLEVIWPDGSRDIVDEHTVTAMYVDADFESIYPVPTSTELTNKYTDLGTMNLGSSATNIDFKAFPKKLSAAAISDGWTTGRSISVTRDGVEIYNRTYADNELFGWNLKDNIDEGGTYLITLRVFAQKGEQIVEKTHKFRVFVKGSTIKTIALEGVGTPVIGKSPSTINTVKSNTDGVVVKRVIWTYWTSEMGGNWFNMPSGSKFEAGKRYAVEIELETADGYSFTANKSDMTVYINGEVAGKSINYSSSEFAADLEFEPITTPTFTTQPVGGKAPYGGKYTVNWATNFTPCKIVVGEYNSLNQVVNQVEYSNTTTSVELPANQYGYVVIAYYNDANAKYSNKITITEVTPAFTTQPVDGVSLGGAYAETSWATNFTPVKLQLVKYDEGPTGKPFASKEDLDVDATSCTVEPGHDYYRIYAYYNDTKYVSSEVFYVTEMNYYNAWFYVDDTVLDKVMVLEGDYVARPADPVKDGYTFLGWYTDDGEKYNFAAPVTDDVHLTAKFKESAASNILKGDLNEDGSVDNLDVEYLLWHTLFPEEYTLNQDGDFTGDGSVDNLDVEYLLWHTLFPEEYPL